MVYLFLILFIFWKVCNISAGTIVLSAGGEHVSEFNSANPGDTIVFTQGEYYIQ